MIAKHISAIISDVFLSALRASLSQSLPHFSTLPTMSAHTTLFMCLRACYPRCFAFVSPFCVPGACPSLSHSVYLTSCANICSLCLTLCASPATSPTGGRAAVRPRHLLGLMRDHHAVQGAVADVVVLLRVALHRRAETTQTAQSGQVDVPQARYRRACCHQLDV